MKKILLNLMLISSILYASSSDDNSWNIKGRLNGYIQKIDLKGKNESQKEKTTHVEDLNLNLSKVLKSGVFGIQTRIRTTNDDNIQTDGSEILYIHTFLKNKIWNLEAGDVAATLNPYVFSGSLKGFKATYKPQRKSNYWTYKTIIGFKKGSWREVFKTIPNERATAYTGGFEAKYIYKKAKEIAFSIGAYKDDLSTGDNNTTFNGKKGIGFGISGKWRFSRYIKLRGRIAVESGTDDLKHNKASKTHTALYIKLLTRPILRSLRSNFSYQRVPTKFISYGGSAPKDIERIENSTTWRINHALKAVLNLKASRDNLDGSLGDTRDIYYEALRLSYYPKFFKRGSIGIRFSNRDIRGRGSNNNRQIYGIDIRGRSKTGLKYGGGFEYNNYDDHNSTSLSQISTIYKVMIGYRHRMDKTRSYNISLRANYQDIHSSQDKVGFKIYAGYIHNKHLSMDLSYNINDTDNKRSNDVTNSIYRFRTTYKIDTQGKKVIRLLLEKSDYDIENDGVNSYNQYKGKLSYSINF